ncbi:methyltransferase [Hydrogenophaga crocea]|uniref:Methyltransferase domain-containing protein n=1 Tax=Hydrogenophaga crocea TaxID=2716225 RepID=A0A6G8IC86_9BURK|nr:methyltransferase [Hydrogenophaga crocea]QIM50646.1 methyltransferase domain-containing protein [Hydrogenophaga crocea]
MFRWRDAWRRWRNQRLSDPAFRERAMASWWGRRAARRSAARLFDVVAGFVYSQVLSACVELDLFERLRGGPVAAERLAAETGLDPAAMQRLLGAGVAIGLFEPTSDGRLALGPLGAPLVGNAAVLALVRHHGAFYADLAEPLALLRRAPGGGRVAAQWPYAGHAQPQALDGASVSAYTELMAASQPLVAQLLLDSHPFERAQRLLDVGGGSGRFLMAAARRAPGLELHLFDLPAVVARAAPALAAAGLADRVRLHGGDFLRDPLPQGMDTATLVRVLHDHDDPEALALLRRVHAALAPGGVLLVAEPMAGTAGAAGMADAYLDLYLWAMGQGATRSAARIGELLAAAGFEAVRECPTALPLQARVLRAHKAGLSNNRSEVGVKTS